jgi:hypothetical protein
MLNTAVILEPLLNRTTGKSSVAQNESPKGMCTGSK